MAGQRKQTAGQGLVPRLRFTEFRECQGWQLQPLRELATIIIEKAGNRKLLLLSITAGIGLVPQKEKFGREIAGSQRKNYYVVHSGDFAYNKSATKDYPEGYVAIYEGSEVASVPNSIFTCFRTRDKQCVGKFLGYQFDNNLHGQWLRRFITVGARAHGSLNIDNNDILAMPVPLPENGNAGLAEQQKIADCLSSLDERITAETRRLDALKTHKQGLLQQLFPRENETVPHLRFPEYRKDGSWKLRAVGDMMPVGSSKRVHQSDWADAGVPFYRAREIVALAEGADITPLHISEQLYREFSSLTGEVQPGHLLVTGVGSIGVPYLVGQGDRFYFKDGNIVWLKNDQKDVSGAFLYLAYTTSSVQNQIKHMAGIGTVGTYTIESARRTQVHFPSGKEEQQKIADFLTSLDDLIAAQARKIDLLKQHKRGLMQQLFPVLDGAVA